MRLLYWIAILPLLFGTAAVFLLLDPTSSSAQAVSTPTPTPVPIPIDEVEEAPLQEAMRIIAGATTDQMVQLFDVLGTAKGAAMMGVMEPVTASHVIEGMRIDKAVEVVSEMQEPKASLVFEKMTTGKAVEMMGKMDIAKASRVWGGMSPLPAGAVFEEVPVDIGVDIIDLLPEEKLIPRLPEVSPQRLWLMPVQFLLEQLPSVPAMHLNSWNRPEVDPELPSARLEQPTSALSIYTVPEVRAGEWALVVGSPAPIETIWARFTRSLNNVRIRVEVLEARPGDTPAPPVGRIANTFLRIGLENAGPDDVSAVAAIVIVDKSWLDANDVHKWSVEFSRLDQQMGRWAPHPSKRIREDQEQVFFAVVVPGFSILAITGSKELPQQLFRVTGLGVTPERPVADEEFTIDALVTNASSQTEVFSAVLWLDNSIEAVRSVPVEAGQSVPLTFKITKPEGTYVVRLDRRINEFTVGSSVEELSRRTAPPAVGGIVPTPGVLIAISVLAFVLILGGGIYLLRWPRST